MERTPRPPGGIRTSMVWGLGGAVLGSLCCAGPAVAVLLGLGGATVLFSLSAYKPVLLALGLLLTGLGVGLSLRRSRATCTPAQHRRNLWFIPSVTLATFLAFYGVGTALVPQLSTAP